MGWKYTEELLRKAVAASVSYAGVLRYLGVVGAGGNHAHISRSIKRLGIDTSHFTGQSWRRGQPSERRKTAAERLVLGVPGSPRVNGEKLRKAMLELGMPYVCAGCGNRGLGSSSPSRCTWTTSTGCTSTNRRENLRFLCPNCHAVTPTQTHAGRNRARLRHLVHQDELMPG